MRIEKIDYYFYKKFIFFIIEILFLCFVLSASVSAKEKIKECIYKTVTFEVKIDIYSDYSAKLYRYRVFSPHEESYNKNPPASDISNWDESLKKAVKEKNKCPTYAVATQGFGPVKYYAYFNKEKMDKRVKDNTSLFSQADFSILTSFKDLKSENDLNISDRIDGITEETDKNNDTIKEFKKTYYLSPASNSEYGKALSFYTKYNVTKQFSVSTRVSLNEYNGSVSLAHKGDISQFSNAILLPIVEQNKWPTDFYCGKITSYLLLDKSATYILGDGKDVVCSVDKATFQDATNKLAHFQANKKNGNYANDEWLPTPTEVPTKEECEANPDLPGCAKNRCEVINTTGGVFKIIKQILGYIQVGSIFAVLIFCVLDLGGAVASSDDEAFRKARNKVFKRIIALILIFLVPLLVNFIINLVNLGACKEEDYDFIGNLFD